MYWFSVKIKLFHITTSYVFACNKRYLLNCYLPIYEYVVVLSDLLNYLLIVYVLHYLCVVLLT